MPRGSPRSRAAATAAPVVGRGHVSPLANSDTVVGRGHASLLTNSAAWHPKRDMDTADLWPTRLQLPALRRGLARALVAPHLILARELAEPLHHSHCAGRE
jgi:hypothetical protein